LQVRAAGADGGDPFGNGAPVHLVLTIPFRQNVLVVVKH
jgi:hypothetical protein